MSTDLGYVEFKFECGTGDRVREQEEEDRAALQKMAKKLHRDE